MALQDFVLVMRFMVTVQEIDSEGRLGRVHSCGEISGKEAKNLQFEDADILPLAA